MTIQNIKPIDGVNLEGKIVVLPEGYFTGDFTADRFRLWRAEDGFGCSPRSNGQAVFATCLADGEVARLERYDFIGWVEQADADAVLSAEDK